MEDILEVYQRPYDPLNPVICIDETNKQLIKEIREYSSIIEAEDNLRLLNKAFEARHISVLDYISDLIYFTDATCEYLDLNHAYRLKLASLERYSMR